jgi:hypothetical protein
MGVQLVLVYSFYLVYRRRPFDTLVILTTTISVISKCRARTNVWNLMHSRFSPVVLEGRSLLDIDTFFGVCIVTCHSRFFFVFFLFFVF